MGANAGLFTVYLGVLVQVKCLSIEPAPQTFALLRRNCSLNPSLAVSLSHLAVSREAELLELEEINATNSGTVRVHSPDAHATGPRFTVSAVPLEYLLSHFGITSVTLLKIDVEGFELSVLRGVDWNGPRRPKNVIVEFTDYTSRFDGNGRSSLLQFFSERGYTGKTVLGQPLSSVDQAIEDNAWFSDTSSRPN